MWRVLLKEKNKLWEKSLSDISVEHHWDIYIYTFCNMHMYINVICMLLDNSYCYWYKQSSPYNMKYGNQAPQIENLAWFTMNWQWKWNCVTLSIYKKMYTCMQFDVCKYHMQFYNSIKIVKYIDYKNCDQNKVLADKFCNKSLLIDLDIFIYL